MQSRRKACPSASASTSTVQLCRFLHRELPGTEACRFRLEECVCCWKMLVVPGLSRPSEAEGGGSKGQHRWEVS